MKSNTILIIAGVGLGAYLLFGKKGSSQETGKYGTKAHLVELIQAKYPDATNTALLMSHTYSWLVDAYEGRIK